MARTADQVSVPRARRRVTISDVSEALGLTKSTVSRALNGYPDIAEQTRLRVRRMADALGYRPLGPAQAIRTGRSKSLGLVIQMADHDAQRPFLAEFLAGVSQGASAEGWTLTLAASTDAADTVQTFRSMIADGKADGFILPRTLIDDPRVEMLRGEAVPFVMFGRQDNPEACAWFDVLGEAAMSEAVHRLYDLGHRHIGFVNGGPQYSYAPLRKAGFLAACRELDLPIPSAQMAEGAVTAAGGEAAAMEILAGPHPPTAIVCAVDMAALGVYRAAARLGLVIGSDLSLVSYDGIPDGAHVSPPLSTFAVDVTASGWRLSNLLIRRIRGEPIEALRETVTAPFLDRGSAGPPRLSQDALAQHIARISA